MGQYFIGGKLGSGGFGDVHLGAHKVTNEKLALKFMPVRDVLAAARTRCLLPLPDQMICSDLDFGERSSCRKSGHRSAGSNGVN